MSESMFSKGMGSNNNNNNKTCPGCQTSKKYIKQQYVKKKKIPQLPKGPFPSKGSIAPIQFPRVRSSSNPLVPVRSSHCLTCPQKGGRSAHRFWPEENASESPRDTGQIPGANHPERRGKWWECKFKHTFKGRDIENKNNLRLGIQRLPFGWIFIYKYVYTSSTAQGGGGSFKNRKRIGEIDCCEWRMSEQKHWPID